MRRRPIVGALCVAGGAVALAVSPALAERGAPRADAPDFETSAPTALAEPASRAVVPAPPSVVAPPARLSFPDRGITASILPVAVVDGALSIPDDPEVVGWWVGSAALGDPSGPVVLAGHLDTAARGPGALAALLAVEPGESVVLEDATGGSTTYVVTSSTSHPKQALPPDLFTPAGPHRLVLVTCGGRFDAGTRHYEDNIVVTAVPG